MQGGDTSRGLQELDPEHCVQRLWCRQTQYPTPQKNCARMGHSHTGIATSRQAMLQYTSRWRSYSTERWQRISIKRLMQIQRALPYFAFHICHCLVTLSTMPPPCRIAALQGDKGAGEWRIIAQVSDSDSCSVTDSAQLVFRT